MSELSDEEKKEDSMQRMLSAIRKRTMGEAEIKYADGKVIFFFNGKPRWTSEDQYRMWQYLAGFRDGSRYTARWSGNWLQRMISGSIRSAINDHGPIGHEQIGSATKRVSHHLKGIFAALFDTAKREDAAETLLTESEEPPPPPAERK